MKMDEREDYFALRPYLRNLERRGASLPGTAFLFATGLAARSDPSQACLKRPEEMHSAKRIKELQSHTKHQGKEKSCSSA